MPNAQELLLFAVTVACALALAGYLRHRRRGQQASMPERQDSVRLQVIRQGALYFRDVLDEVRRRLAPLPPEARAAFAVACAEQALARHEGLPAGEQRPFTRSWRPVLEAIWAGLHGDETAAVTVRQALDAFHASPYDHTDGQDGPDDAEDEAAAACIYAAQCYLGGSVDAAVWAANCVVDQIDRVVVEALTDPDDPGSFPDETAIGLHPANQQTLRTLLDYLTLIEHHDVNAATLRQLRS